MVGGRIAVFASGEGTNAENIIRYFRGLPCGVEVALVLTNRGDAGVVRRAECLGVPVVVATKGEINDREFMMPLMDRYGIGVVVLAGFLLMVPPFLIGRYNGRMVNIHPSLLPKYGGKGMYGRRVHEAVIAGGERETGITIHLVSEHYDEGRILFQASVPVVPTDTIGDVDRKVRAMELFYFPRVIHRTFFGATMETDRLLLRAWRDDDAEALFRYAADPEVGPIAGWPAHTSVQESLRVIREVFSAPETYAVVLKESGEPVGCIGLLFGDNRNSREMQPNEAEVGYWIGVLFWGQGLIPEALDALIQRGFRTLGLDAMWISLNEANVRSRRVAEKCGFTYHHTEPGENPVTGERVSNRFYRLTIGEYAAQHKA